MATREIDLVEIGRRFREVREQLAVGQTEMAARLGVSQGMLSQYERGVVEPPLTIIVKLCDVGDRTLDWVVLGEG